MTKLHYFLWQIAIEMILMVWIQTNPWSDEKFRGNYHLIAQRCQEKESSKQQNRWPRLFHEQTNNKKWVLILNGDSSFLGKLWCPELAKRDFEIKRHLKFACGSSMWLVNSLTKEKTNKSSAVTDGLPELPPPCQWRNVLSISRLLSFLRYMYDILFARSPIPIP